MRKIVLTYGLIAGAMLSAMMSLTIPFHDELGLDQSMGMVLGYTTMVISFLMVYFGVRTYRDTVAGGTVTFGKAFLVGILIAGIATLCYIATWEVMFNKFMPDYMEKYGETVVAKARANGESEAEIAKRQQEMAQFAESYRNPLVRMAWTFLEPLPVALLFSLVSAGVLSRRRRVGEAVA
jgi:hypothetical protein